MTVRQSDSTPCFHFDGVKLDGEGCFQSLTCPSSVRQQRFFCSFVNTAGGLKLYLADGSFTLFLPEIVSLQSHDIFFYYINRKDIFAAKT
jgi:hypothetical protein